MALYASHGRHEVHGGHDVHEYQTTRAGVRSATDVDKTQKFTKSKERNQGSRNGSPVPKRNWELTNNGAGKREKEKGNNKLTIESTQMCFTQLHRYMQPMKGWLC